MLSSNTSNTSDERKALSTLAITGGRQYPPCFYFWLFLFLHTVLWTIGPLLARHSLPHDVLEGITWGLQGQLGYHKHPFLTAWLCAGISQLLGAVDWPVYFLAQLSVAITFWAVWQLAKKLLGPKQALIAALVLEGVLFYNINSFNLTPDTMQSPLWALLSLFFYQALSRQKIHYWLLTGLLAALCVCTKYQVAVLLLPMFLLCVIHPVARLSFKQSGIYWGLAIFLFVITPHLIWLYQHHFITVVYAQQVSKEYTHQLSFFNHISYPIRLIINLLINISGMFFLLWPFYSKLYSAKQDKPILSTFQWHVLCTLAFGPLVLTLGLCMLSGDYFPPRWLTPYCSLYGIIAIAYLNPILTSKRMYYFACTLILFSILLFGARISSLTLFPRTESDAFLPNKEIALALSKLWHQDHNISLPYLAGSNYLVSSVLPYMPDKPQPYLSWSQEESPWIEEQQLNQKGGLFIWDEGQNYTWDKDSQTYSTLPEGILMRFPTLHLLPHYIFYRSSDQHPIVIGVALLEPKKQ